MGRIDFTNPKLPRFWQPAVTISIRFTGASCRLIVNDEILWGKNHNYFELVVDGKAYRLQTKSARDTIDVTSYLSGKKEHNVSFVKNTEANIGYIEFRECYAMALYCHLRVNQTGKSNSSETPLPAAPAAISLKFRAAKVSGRISIMRI